MQAGRDLLLQAQEAQRRAALTGRTEGGRQNIVDDLLDQSGRVDDHGVDPARLGDERRDRAVAFGERAIDALRDLDRAGEDDARRLRIGDERRADGAVAWRELQRVSRRAGFMQEPDRQRRDERRLLCGLRDDGVAGHERGGDLPDENRQREIPWRNANENAAPLTTQDVGLSCRSRQRGVGADEPRLAGVIAAKIRRLANFGERVVERLARFALQ